MFQLRRLIVKTINVIDIILTPIYCCYLFVLKAADVSLYATVRASQFFNLRFGRRIIIEPGCLLDASGQSVISVGDDVIVQRHTQIITARGSGISIGSRTSINRQSVLYGRGGLRFGCDCLVGPQCIFIASNHRFDDTSRPIREQGDTALGIHIGNNVWFGAGVKVLDGVRIGDNCVIGAGAVVNKDIPADSIAVGVPARVVKKREPEAEQNTSAGAENRLTAVAFS